MNTYRRVSDLAIPDHAKISSFRVDMHNDSDQMYIYADKNTSTVNIEYIYRLRSTPLLANQLDQLTSQYGVMFEK